MNSPKQIVDTSPDSEAILIQLVREQQPMSRVANAISSSNRVAEQCKNAIRRMNPGIGEDEVRLRFIELNYGPELATDVEEFLAGK